MMEKAIVTGSMFHRDGCFICDRRAIINEIDTLVHRSWVGGGTPGPVGVRGSVITVMLSQRCPDGCAAKNAIIRGIYRDSSSAKHYSSQRVYNYRVLRTVRLWSAGALHPHSSTAARIY
jgi:hypothetical protein